MRRVVVEPRATADLTRASHAHADLVGLVCPGGDAGALRIDDQLAGAGPPPSFYPPRTVLHFGELVGYANLLPRMPYPLFDHLARRPCDWETEPQPDGRAVVTIRRNASHDQS